MVKNFFVLGIRKHINGLLFLNEKFLDSHSLPSVEYRLHSYVCRGHSEPHDLEPCKLALALTLYFLPTEKCVTNKVTHSDPQV